MAAEAPVELKTPEERWLWGEIAEAYESNGGSDPSKFPEHTRRFVRVLDAIRARLVESPEFKQAG